MAIVDQLDVNLGWSSLQFTELGFGDQIIVIPDGNNYFRTVVDMTYNGKDFQVDIELALNPETGELTAVFQSLDPTTSLPPDVLTGFLPPEDGTGRGKGYISYVVNPRQDLPTGTEIRNIALITFDWAETIATNQIDPHDPSQGTDPDKECLNTIDAGVPTSAVAALAAETYPGFLVRWTGEDEEGGSGVVRYDVYVSQGIAGAWEPYTRWLSQTDLTEARYLAAEAGQQYRFYSVAYDGVGHEEPAPPTADTETTVLPPSTVVDVVISNVPRPTIAIEFSDAMDVQRMIDDGSIVEAIVLAHIANGPVQLAASQFGYNPAANTLTLTCSEVLPAGYYELRLDGNQIMSDDGAWLRGDASGIRFQIGTFDVMEYVTTDNTDLEVNAYSVPSLVDWNGDGLVDMIVGEKTADSLGKIRIYLNEGTNELPVFGTYSYAQTGEADLAVSADGCLGVFPRVYDWNGDGKKDLVLGLADGSVQVALNENTDSEPLFGVPEYVQFGEVDEKANLNAGGRATLEIVDWNNDGRDDLVVGGLDGRVRLYLNEAASGIPDFRTEMFIQDGSDDLVVSSGRASIAVADLNGDGRKDLILGDTNGRLRFYPNMGTDSAPKFNGWQAIEADGAEIDLPGTARSRPFVGDFNADGISDLLLGAEDGLVRLYAGLTPGKPAEVADPLVGLVGSPYVHTFQVGVYANTAPTADAGGPYTVAEGGTIELDASGSTDPDMPVDTLTYAWDFDGDGQYDDATGISPDFSAAALDGPATVTVGLLVMDSFGETSTAAAGITILNVAPVLGSVSATATTEGGTSTFTGSITDPGILDAFLLAVDWGDGSLVQVFSYPAGTTSFSETHQYPEECVVESFTITVMVSDEEGTDAKTISVTVAEVNVAPVLGAIGNKQVDELVELAFTATANDQDLPTQTLTFSLAGAPEGATINATTGQFAWMPGEAQDGVHTFSMVVSDGELTDSEEITVTVAEVTNAPIDLGAVDFRQLNALSLANGSLYYQLQTAHAGFLTLDVLAPIPPKSARIRLYDQNPLANPGLTPLATSALVGANQRAELLVETGATYFVELYGANTDFNLRIANLVQHDGTTVTVFGTASDDQFLFGATNSRLVSIKGVDYEFADSEVSLIEFNGGEGYDRVELRDSSGDETLEAWATQATFSNSASDAVTDFTVNVSNFEELQGYANSGGEDSAVLHGSEQNDKFKAEPAENYAKMYGGMTYHRVKFFDLVDAHGGGGKDLARVFDTAGNETFEGTMGLSTFAGDGFEIGMHDFRQVLALATAGGNDTATLTDSARKDQFYGKAHKSEMLDVATDGDVYNITVRAFDVVHARATDQTAGNGGNDIAKLSGTALDDYVEAAEDWLRYGVRRPELDPLYEILAFESVIIRQTPGGNDQADADDNRIFELAFDDGWEMV